MTNLYGIFETQVINTKTYSNPFDYTVIELQATFTSPSGRNINFFGFYDGDGNGGQTGSIWKLRFMPDEVGTWNYTYTWTDGTSGGSGSFNVVDTGLLGPIKVATDNPWYFMDSRGNPFNANGYSMHVFQVDGSYFFLNFNDNINQYINGIDTYVIPSGYNLVMIIGPGYYSAKGHNWWYDDGITTDLDRFNLTTWKNWDTTIDYYQANRIYIFPFSLIPQWDMNTVGSTRIQKFYRYYTARSASYWNLFGHGLTWEWSELWSESTINGWMQPVRNYNPSGNLLTIHDTMRESFSGWGSLSMRQLQTKSVFTGNTRTGGQHGGVQGSFVNKPIIGAEDIWERPGSTTWAKDATEVRRGAWGDMMAGVIPIYEDWSWAGGNGSGKPEVLRMFNFFYSKTNYRQYQQLNNLVSSTARQIASGTPGQEYLVYDEDGGSINIDLSGTSPSDTFSVLWFDPKNGTEQTGPNINGGSFITLTSLFIGDTVLLLQNVSCPQLICSLQVT